MPRKPIRAEELPLFAQPLHRRAVSAHPSNRPDYLKGMGWFCLPFAVVGALLVLARPDQAQTNVSRADKPAHSIPTVLPKADKKSDESAPADKASSGRRSLDFYTSGVRSSMFSAPQPPAPKPPPVKIEKPKPAPHVPVMEVNPFTDWAYTGTVRMGDQIMALLENTKTKEGQYVKIGEMFMGAQATSITDQMVTLMSAGKPRMLAKADTITLTPLDKSAAFLSGPATPPPGQPGAPPGQPPQMGAPPPGPQPGMVILPNGRVLTGDQAARRARGMNRRFNRQ